MAEKADFIPVEAAAEELMNKWQTKEYWEERRPQMEEDIKNLKGYQSQEGKYLVAAAVTYGTMGAIAFIFWISGYEIIMLTPLFVVVSIMFNTQYHKAQAESAKIDSPEIQKKKDELADLAANVVSGNQYLRNKAKDAKTNSKHEKSD